MANVGSTAPVFTLPDTDRAPRSLSEFTGKKTVLAFYPGAFTGVCTKEMCTFRDSLAEFNSMDANIVGISIDSPFANKAFKDQNQINFPLLSDFDRKVIQAYGIHLENFAGVDGYNTSQRAVFILDKDGKIAYEWIGENPGVEPNYSEIKAALANV